MWLAWLSPNHYPPWAAAHSELLAALALCALSAAAATVAVQRVQVGRAVPLPSIFFAAMAAIPLMQWAGGLLLFFGDAWIVALYLSAAALATWSAARLEQWRPGVVVDLLATALLAGALATCFVTLAQRAAVDLGPWALYVVDVRPGRPPIGNMAQPNQTAMLCALGLVALLYLHDRQRVRSVLAGGALVVLILSQSATLSRAPGLLWTVALVAVVVMRSRFRCAALPVVVGLSAVAWGLCYWAWTQVPYIGMPARGAEVLAARLEVGPRTTMWLQLAQAVGQEPWLGWGWNQVSLAQWAVALRFPDSRMTEHSHNLPLDLMLWTGVPLAVVLMATSGVWLAGAARRAVDAGAAAALLIVLLLLTHSMVEFPLDYLYFLVPFAMAIGVMSSRMAIAAAPAKWPGFQAFKPLAIAAPLVIAVCAVDYWRVEAAFRELRFAVARIGQVPAELPRPPLSLFTQLTARMSLPLHKPARGMEADVLQSMTDATRRFATPSDIARLALSQGLNGNHRAAQDSLQLLLHLHGSVHHARARAEFARLADSEYPELRLVIGTDPLPR